MGAHLAGHANVLLYGAQHAAFCGAGPSMGALLYGLHQERTVREALQDAVEETSVSEVTQAHTHGLQAAWEAHLGLIGAALRVQAQDVAVAPLAFAASFHGHDGPLRTHYAIFALIIPLHFS